MNFPVIKSQYFIYKLFKAYFNFTVTALYTECQLSDSGNNLKSNLFYLENDLHFILEFTDFSGMTPMIDDKT